MSILRIESKYIVKNIRLHATYNKQKKTNHSAYTQYLFFDLNSLSFFTQFSEYYPPHKSRTLFQQPPEY